MLKLFFYVPIKQQVVTNHGKIKAISNFMMELCRHPELMAQK